MNNSLAMLLEEYLLQQAQQINQIGDSRLVLSGIPVSTLRVLFEMLTRGDGSLWQPAGGSPIPVFLVTQVPSNGSIGQSRECNWDYALAVRNSFPSFLLLVDPLVWDDRTYSIINATDTIGFPLPPVGRKVPALRSWSSLYANIVELAAERIGIKFTVVESAIREALKDLPSLEPVDQHLLPWCFVARIVILAESGHEITNNDLARICGLLPSENNSSNFGRSRKTLERMASFLEDSGLEEGIQILNSTSRGSSLNADFDDIRSHLRGMAGSASAVVRAPSFYYFEPNPASGWWNALTVDVVNEMLVEVGRSAQPDEIMLSCRNSLNPLPSSGEPTLVKEGAILEARHPKGNFQRLRIYLRHGQRTQMELAAPEACQSPFTYEDAPLPSHHTLATYSIEDHDAKPSTLKVLSLASYKPGAFVTCPGTTTRKISKPRQTRGNLPWQQQFFLRSGGAKTFKVFCGPQVNKLRVTYPLEMQSELEIGDGSAEIYGRPRWGC